MKCYKFASSSILTGGASRLYLHLASGRGPRLGIYSPYALPVTLSSTIALIVAGIAVAILLGTLILGRWKRNLIRRLQALAGAANEFRGTPEVTRKVSKYLELSAQNTNDEVTELGKNIEQMMHSVQRSEQALRASEVRFRALIENSNDAVALLDGEGVLMYCSPASTKIQGFAPEELVGRNAAELVHPDDLPILQRALEEVSSAPGNVTALTARVRHKNGTWRLAEGTFTNLLQHPEVHAIIVNYRDVSERERTQEALRRSEEKFETAFQASPLAISITTMTEGRILDANKAFEELMECPREEFIGRTTAEIGIWEKADDRAALLQQLSESGNMTAAQTRIRTRKGRIRQVEISAGLISLEDVTCVLAIAHDVTGERTLEQQLRQAQKMEAVGQLAGGVAHDFNNMVMIINGCAELIKDASEEDKKITRLADQILSAGNKAALVTKQLLAFGRKQPQDLKVLDMNKVVSEFCKILPRLLGDDIQMKVTPLAELPMIYSDAGQIEQVIMNLVVNARDAMPGGGKLTVETSNVDVNEDYSDLHGAKLPPDKYVMLAISDTGFGMDAETQTRIFEPFFTTKQAGKGSGLGLATVYGIVKQNGGFIWVYSEVGLGTTFKVYLPRADTGKNDELASSIDKVSAVGGSETILVVEDQEALRTLLAGHLASQGYQVLQAENGIVARHICESRSDPIDLILTDVVMPGLSGPEFVRAALKTHPESRVIFMSGYADRALDDAALKKGSVSLQKPFGLRSALQAIRKVLDQKQNVV